MAVQNIQGSRYAPAALYIGEPNYADAAGTLVGPQGATSLKMPYAGKIIAFHQTMSGTLDTGTLQFRPVIAGTVGALFDGTFLSTASTSGPSTEFTYKTETDSYPFLAGDTLSIVVQKAGTVSPTTMDSDGFIMVVFNPVEY
jgi:hypothetical protein